jgi:hypothetical protein
VRLASSAPEGGLLTLPERPQPSCPAVLPRLADFDLEHLLDNDAYLRPGGIDIQGVPADDAFSASLPEDVLDGAEEGIEIPR